MRNSKGLDLGTEGAAVKLNVRQAFLTGVLKRAVYQLSGPR